MPVAGSVPCADLGTEYCPCSLAFAGSCVYCTMIQTGDTCACRWAGTCVLLHIGSPAAVRRALAGRPDSTASGQVRRSSRAPVLSATAAAPGVIELHLALGAGECAGFRRPGAFLIVRPAPCPARYDLPLTVVETGSRSVRLVFRVAGPKSRALSGLVRGDTASWRGPYYSGLMGGHRLVRGGVARAVVVARGLGQAVAIPVAAWLRARGTRVSVLLDPRGAGGAFAASELAAVTGAEVRMVTCYRPEGLAAVADAVAQRGGDGEDRRTGPETDVRAVRAAGPDERVLLVSCGSDLQHRWIAGVWPQLQDVSSPARIDLVASNNSLVVCGEGTCGACTRRLSGGRRVRGCKADVPPENVWPAAGRSQDLSIFRSGAAGGDVAGEAEDPVPRGASADG